MSSRFTLLCVVALLGCGSSATPLTEAEYCTEYAKAECDGLVPACYIKDATCNSLRIQACTTDAAAQHSSEQHAGRYFLPSNAEACLGKVRAFYSPLSQSQATIALGVNDYKAMTAACGDVYRGSIVAYAACPSGEDADCIDGLVCDKGYCGPKKMITQGGCANIGEYCSQGYYCSNATGAYFCTAKVGQYGACGPSLPCLENLRCTAAGICDVLLDKSEVCSVDQECSTGFCDPYANKCTQYISFADGSSACLAMGGSI